MKIAFINQPWNSVHPPVQSGSIAIWTDRIAHRLKSTDSVVIYSNRAPGQPEYETYQGVEYRHISVGLDPWMAKVLKRLPNRLSGGHGFSSAWYYGAYIRQIAAWLRRESVDVVHIHNFSQFIPVVRRYNPQVRIALHMHTDWLGGLNPTLLRPRLEQADFILGCSQYVTRLAQEAFPGLADRCHTLHNGVDAHQFSPPDQPSQGPPRLLYVGRLSPEKGVDVLIEAFSEVRRCYPDAALEIIGPNSVTPLDFLLALPDQASIQPLLSFYTGPGYLERLKSMVKEDPNLQGAVRFTGGIPQDELVSRYRRASLLVNPSYNEAFGMSQIEAMACGLPVVASSVGGMREVVLNGETGLWVEPGNAGALARSIIALLGDPDRCQRMGQAGRQRVLERFTWEQVSTTLQELYSREISPQSHQGTKVHQDF